MSLLNKPEAQVLLGDAELNAATVRSCAGRLLVYVKRYLPLFYRAEQRDAAVLVLRGKLSGLERKTSEPIAKLAKVAKRKIQDFVGEGCWDDEKVMKEMRVHVGAEIGDPKGILLVDGSGFAKKGTESCGVARQWCGRLGKVENCQVGVFLGYASPKGHAPLDRQLYLPAEWTNDKARLDKCHVPEDVKFQEKWRIALDLIERSSPDVPHRWVGADDEFGRVTAFRGSLRLAKKRYVLDVPSNTLVRNIDERRGDGGKPAFETAHAWAARQPKSAWRKIPIRDGEKGPLHVMALECRMQTKDEDGHVGTVERLVVTKTVEATPRLNYALSNAKNEPLKEVVRVGSERHRIEEVLQEGKGEVGLGHYEMRSWIGWHHHVTLTMLALWFLVMEKRRIKKKTPAITVQQVRQIFTNLLLPNPPTFAEIAAEISGTLLRNEEARIYHYYKATKRFPPRKVDVNSGRERKTKQQVQ